MEPVQLKPLPDSVLEQLMAVSSEGRAAWKRGDIVSAETHFLAAWSLIPDPKVEYDYAQSLARGFVDFYRDAKDFSKALDWVRVTETLYDPENPSVALLSGMTHFDAGHFDHAFHDFRRAYSVYKKRIFQGYDPKYYAFYNERRKAHGKRK